MIDERGWQDPDDLARAYVAWSGYAYGNGIEGAARHGLFESRLARLEAIVQNQDNREHDLLDSDDYWQFEGGLAAAAKLHGAARPVIYHVDHSRPERPRPLTLEEEIGRIVRARAANPRWIAGVMRHGYKGAAEIAATVDYLFAFAATTGAVGDHHFEALYDAYLGDDDVRAFLDRHNPAARADIARRLAEAIERGLWRPRANHAFDHLNELAGAPT
jgi:cobaltochelatase CobN